MSTKELQIAERARNHKREAMTNLHQFIDEELLHKSYQGLNKNSSPGVDGKDWHNYSLESEVRIPELLKEFKSGKYKAPSIRRAYISKGKSGKRPLGIPTIEDKILQESVPNVLTPILSNSAIIIIFSIPNTVEKVAELITHPNKFESVLNNSVL